MYLLDTDTCIYYLEGRAPNVVRWLRETPADQLGTTAITAAELRFAALRSGRVSANLERAERFLAQLANTPFDDFAAVHYGHIKQLLFAAGKPIGGFDMLIAAIVLSTDATLVTNNVREFSRIPGLRLENWRN